MCVCYPFPISFLTQSLSTLSLIVPLTLTAVEIGKMSGSKVLEHYKGQITRFTGQLKDVQEEMDYYAEAFLLDTLFLKVTTSGITS